MEKERRTSRSRLVQILERPAGQQFALPQRPEVVSSFVFLDTTGDALAPAVVRNLKGACEQLLTFYEFPQTMWKSI